MSDSGSQRDFLNRLNAGTDSAWEELYTRHIQRLCEVAARLIGERLRSQYAAEDAAHSALGSFFRGMTEKQYRFDQSGRLWSLLVTILRHKIQDRGRKAREEHLSEDVVDRNPSREAAVDLVDAFEAAITGLKPLHQEICRLYYLECLTVSDIVGRLGCSRWMVRRVLNEFESRLRQRLGDNPRF